MICSICTFVAFCLIIQVGEQDEVEEDDNEDPGVHDKLGQWHDLVHWLVVVRNPGIQADLVQQK